MYFSRIKAQIRLNGLDCFCRTIHTGIQGRSIKENA